MYLGLNMTPNPYGVKIDKFLWYPFYAIINQAELGVLLYAFEAVLLHAPD